MPIDEPLNEPTEPDTAKISEQLYVERKLAETLDEAQGGTRHAQALINVLVSNLSDLIGGIPTPTRIALAQNRVPRFQPRGWNERQHPADPGTRPDVPRRDEPVIEHPIDPCSGGCTDPERHTEGGHDA